ncbi:unnamed protein product [Ixodes pacificus]
MDVVQVEGQELRPDEFGEGSGWCEIKRNKKRADSAMESAKTQQQGHQQTGATSTSVISTVADKAAKYKKKNARKVSQIAMASRMPDLPTDDYKVVVRPRGGFNVSDHKRDRIYCCLRSAAGIGREAAEEDSICLNVRQNVVVLRTPSEDRANKYGAITKLRIGEREYEASAYRAAPENTSKGLVRGISKDENPADIVRSLVTKRNPSVLHAKRMGNTDNVIVLFDGFHVPRYVFYGAMLVRRTLYKKQIDVCHECGRLGHRANVCPSPTTRYAAGAAAAARLRNTGARRSVSYAAKVTSRETASARPNTRSHTWSSGANGNEEYEKKKKPPRPKPMATATTAVAAAAEDTTMPRKIATWATAREGARRAAERAEAWESPVRDLAHDLVRAPALAPGPRDQKASQRRAVKPAQAPPTASTRAITTTTVAAVTGSNSSSNYTAIATGSSNSRNGRWR